jgi:hypothetical protein
MQWQQLLRVPGAILQKIADRPRGQSPGPAQTGKTKSAKNHLTGLWFAYGLFVKNHLARCAARLARVQGWNGSSLYFGRSQREGVNPAGSVQYDEVALAEALVRETIQNSTDAGATDKHGSRIVVRGA